MLQLLGGRWERNPAAEQRICGRSHAQYAVDFFYARKPLECKALIRMVEKNK